MDSAPTSPVDRTTYAAFIGQIELRSVWLRSARIDNGHGRTQPEDLSIIVDGQSRWERTPEGFRAFQTYKIRLGHPGPTSVAEIEVTFAADYESSQQMSEGLFEVFRESNLPLNTWPYVREYVATTVGRFGWIPVTLPALKIGTPPRSIPKETHPASSAQPKKRARKKALEQ